VKSKAQFMAAYSAGRAAYQNLAMDDIRPREAWVYIAALAIVGALSQILLERYTSVSWIGRQGLCFVALSVVWSIIFGTRNRGARRKRN
jgi:hypothetical protein